MTTQRIAMFRNGSMVPRFDSQPAVSSAKCQWTDVQLEQHQLTMSEEWAGVIDGYQICFNIGPAAPVFWKVNGSPQERLVGGGLFSLAMHGSLRIVRWPKPMQFLLLSLAPRLMMECSAEAGHRAFPELIEHLGHRDVQVEGLVRLLQADMLSGSPAGRLYGEQLGVGLAVYLSTRFLAHRLKGKNVRSALPGMVLKRIYEYVDGHLEKSISLEQLAEQSGMSRFYFSRLFRNSTGQTPSQYVTRRRVERAKQLLTDGDLTLRAIATATGFSSQSHFCAIFKAKTGATPAQYRLLAS